MEKDEYEKAWSEDSSQDAPIENAVLKSQQTDQAAKAKEFEDAFNEDEPKPSEKVETAGIGAWLRKKVGMETEADRKESGTERKPTAREKQIEEGLKKAQA